MKYSEVIGQQDATHRLQQLVSEDRVPHAVMLCGPTGYGSLALAMAFASHLLGESDAHGHSLLADPARVRNAEAMLAKWEHPDLHFTYPVIRPKGTSSDHKMVSDDFAKEWHRLLNDGPYLSMDEWMEAMGAENQQAVIYEGESDALMHKLSLKSSQGGYKVSLMWLPERMNATCANKLLKLLEEPPQQTVFIMACEEPERLLETIRSRVQRIDVQRIDNDAMCHALVQRRGIDEASAKRIAHVANGNWQKALEELDAGNEKSLFLDSFIKLMRLAYMRNIKELKQWSEEVAAYGREKQRRMLRYYTHLLRENFMYNFREPDIVYMTQPEEDFAKNFARFINETNVIGFFELFAKCERDIGQNANGKMVFFDMALKTIMLLIGK